LPTPRAVERFNLTATRTRFDRPSLSGFWYEICIVFDAVQRSRMAASRAVLPYRRLRFVRAKRRAVSVPSVQLNVAEEKLVNLHLTGHHLEITPAIRAYVVSKLDRVSRHFDHVIDVSLVLSVDKLRQIVEANVHVRGKDIHAASVDPDMYAAIDALADKLNRQVMKHKEKLTDHRCDTDARLHGADGVSAD
jgi:putative sigma-54 modulation protein